MPLYKNSKGFNSEIDGWLKKFGATAGSNKLPICFNPAFLEEWELVSLHKRDPLIPKNLDTLLTIVDFLNYTGSIKAYPFLRKGIKVKPDSITSSLTNSLVKDQATELRTYLVKTGVVHAFSLYKKVVTVNIQGNLMLTIVAKPLNSRNSVRQSIVGIIQTFCKVKTVPPQLEPSKSKTTSLLVNSSVYDWFPVTTLSMGAMYCTVSDKDFLIRVVFDDIPIFTTKKQLTASWKQNF
jgi:CRISPR/Cas system-associated protein endoribonuclease Cas2